MHPDRALQYSRTHRARFVSELKEFLRFPSVSSRPERANDVKRCAHWLALHLQKIGLTRVQVIPTRGHPIVYASSRLLKGRPTLLIYGHYDVVSEEPLAHWHTSPFRPTIQGDSLYARGASDDKGQLFCHVKALECCLRATRTLPVNVKCIFEGEEEIGSTHLLSFIARNKRALHADAAVISDTRMAAPNRPAISYAQRGGLRAELEIRGPGHELHAGTFGGAVHNPIQALCETIAQLHDKHGHITIPGFYDDVRKWSEAERNYMARSGPDDETLLRDAATKQDWGEPEYTLYERTTIRPALTLNGIAGGHVGTGVKGVIPTSALAKLSFRLVPEQDPAKIGELLRKHIARITPSDVTSTLRISSPIQPAVIDRNHPAMHTAAIAYRKGFGASPVFLRSGGSIPVVHAFGEYLGIPTVLMGFGLPDDRIHAPNEKFHLPTFFRAINTSIWFLATASDTLGPHNHIANKAQSAPRRERIR